MSLQQDAIRAETMGKQAYHACQATSYDAASAMARGLFNSVLMQDAFVAGWHIARWNAEHHELAMLVLNPVPRGE